MKIAILKERRPDEPRVAATPDTVKKFRALGIEVAVETGAGEGAALSDQAFAEQGAVIAPDAAAAAAGADLVLKVRQPLVEELEALPQGVLLACIMDPHRSGDELASLARHGVTGFALDFMPRISRAQSMDVLSSQANLAGYKAVIDAAAAYGRAFPMMMTPAGRINPAQVLVMGAGVAGLQAIATAKRLGAVVHATDVRPAAKEQVLSLGGKFLAVEDEEFREAETAGGYAKEMSAEYQKKQAALLAEAITKMDVVITTALIPGRPAPLLVSEPMLRSMKAGSVIVDLAVENGGNVALSRPGEVVEIGGVNIIGYRNVPGRLAADASMLYANNLFNFVSLLFNKETKTLEIDWEDEIVKGTLVTRDGAVVHAALTSTGKGE